MCEAVVESPVSYDLSRPLSSKQPNQRKLERLLERLPRLREDYDLERKVGEGTFSCVYLGKSRLDPGLKVAVKHVIPTCHPTRIARELKCMHHLGGQDNIVQVISCYRMNDCVVFVMPYQPHDKFSSYVGSLSSKELQTYLRGLLTALRRIHSYAIIHRDIKPSNFLFHRKTQSFLLVDFGLAQNVEECVNGESTENFSSIKIELKEPSTQESSHHALTDKKRKRDSTEANDGVCQASKRPALRLLTDNISCPEGKCKPLLSRSLSETPRAANPLSPRFPLSSKLANLMSSQPKDSALLDSSLVVKRNAYSQPYSSSILRSHAQEVKVVGGMFAKPHPVGGGVGATQVGGGGGGTQGRRCHCDGRPRFCQLCLTRPARAAPRAGTPGFRPPEVLLKYPNQTTAVDMWAVGVIMLSVLSSTYPFFKSPDDITALAELITLFGTEEMKALAKKLGRNIVCSESNGPLDLRKLCDGLRRRQRGEENQTGAPLASECSKCRMPPGQACLCPSPGYRPTDLRFPPEAYHLLERLLDIDPETRITAQEALSHPFLTMKL